jgi:hypothetical protein
MSAAVDQAHGLTVTLGTSATTMTIISGPDWSGLSRAAIETTNMATAAAGAGKIANRTYIPSKLVSPGTISMVMSFNPDDDPPMQGDEAVETITVQYAPSGGDTTGGKWAADGFVTEWNPNAPEDDRMTVDCTIQLSGNITITDGS